MKRPAFLLSLSVLVHLSIVDMVYYFVNPELSLNFIAILGYNIAWLIIAVMIGNQVYNPPRSSGH